MKRNIRSIMRLVRKVLPPEDDGTPKGLAIGYMNRTGNQPGLIDVDGEMLTEEEFAERFPPYRGTPSALVIEFIKPPLPEAKVGV